MAGSSLDLPGASGTWSTLVGSGNVPRAPGDPLTLIELDLSIGLNTFQWERVQRPLCEQPYAGYGAIILYDDTTAAANAGPIWSSACPSPRSTCKASSHPLPAEGTWTLIERHRLHRRTERSRHLGHRPRSRAPTPSSGPWSGIPARTTDPHRHRDRAMSTNPNAPTGNAGPDQELCHRRHQHHHGGQHAGDSGRGHLDAELGAAEHRTLRTMPPRDRRPRVGCYQFVWEIYNGVCGFGPPSRDTVQVDVFDQRSAGCLARGDISWCTPTSSACSPPRQIRCSLLWAPGRPPAAARSPIRTIRQQRRYGLTVGQHDFQWTIDNGACGIEQRDQRVHLR
jgi:hypothetical protein